MNLLKNSADNSRTSSVSNRFRRKRFNFFLEFIKELHPPVRILDVGGTANFWEQMGFKDFRELNITILNTELPSENLDFLKFIKGDARDLSMFKDNEFDVVFSNSVIEHVGGYGEQKKMADEIIRTGKRFFVQTPNYLFPLEPHFLFPFFQFMPRGVKIFMLTHFNMGWYNKCVNKDEALKILESVNLLTLKNLKKLFKNGKIYKEKFILLNKSFIIYN